jgi:hypothetical protein
MSSVNKSQNNTIPVKKVLTPFCNYCFKKGQEPRMYNSHFTHKTSSQNSKIVCPLLLPFVCKICTSGNHTYDRCKKQQSSQQTHAAAAVSVCLPVKNRFQIDDDEEPEVNLIEDNKNDDEWIEMKDPQSGKPFWMNIQSGSILSFDPATRGVVTDNDW